MPLSIEQENAVNYRGKNLQIIASAGSGKTETISVRCATLLKEGIKPNQMICFTFTERAAEELKSRIERHVRMILGDGFLGQINNMYVGTIHAFCLQFLQKYQSEYEIFDMINEHRLVSLVSKEFDRIGISNLGDLPRWKAIRIFLDNVSVMENDYIQTEQIEKTVFGSCYKNFLQILHDYKVLTFGQVLALTVKVLEIKDNRDRIFGNLKHLIVDEYQDINPVQARLISLLSDLGNVSLTVVGDDLQAIYQWRGADVTNIINFSNVFPDVTKLKLTVNRRSRPSIINTAEHFADSIKPRLPKIMGPYRESSPLEITKWSSDTPNSEANTIAEAIENLLKTGYHYKDIAILLRSVRTSSEPIIQSLINRGIPFRASGRTGLFLHQEIQLLAKTYAWIIDKDWRESQWSNTTKRYTIEELLSEYGNLFSMNDSDLKNLSRHLMEWRTDISLDQANDLVSDFYVLLKTLKLSEWDQNDDSFATSIGIFARFSELLLDLETVIRRAKKEKSGIINAYLNSKSLYEQLYIYMQYYAVEAYEDFPGEDNVDLDAVEISTIHQAKGLEWPIVFLPCISSRRFPSSLTGTPRQWFIPRNLFQHRRYEGSIMDERRLFYVALTRARDLLYASSFKRMNQPVNISTFLLELNSGSIPQECGVLPVPNDKLSPTIERNNVPTLGFSDLSLYEFCPFAYRLRTTIGFRPKISIRLNYGRSIHHILRSIGDYVKTNKKVPGTQVIEDMIEKEFYLPYSPSYISTKIKEATKKIILRVATNNKTELERIWETERNFTYYRPTCIISGRADAILDNEQGIAGNVALIDYKVSTEKTNDDKYRFQLSIYALAAKDEGLNVRNMYLFDLKNLNMIELGVEEKIISKYLTRAENIVENIMSRNFQTKVGEHCKQCDVMNICSDGINWEKSNAKGK